ncbi:hypothetical protein BGZ81_006289 [Podila clonocystis]|nr:hypothetical protein BGZ81_006289 [Podila clonocystis]
MTVPCSKTGGLVPAKGAIISPNLSDRYFGYGMKGKVADGARSADPRYPDNFQVALTVRKVTQSDIEGNDILRRRYEYTGPAFVFLDKDQVKDSATAPQNQDAETTLYSEANLDITAAGVVSSLAHEESTPQFPQKITRI